MKNFFNMYPEFVYRKLYLAGESYAGKFVPMYASKMMSNSAVFNL